MTDTIDNNQNGNAKTDTQSVELAEDIRLEVLTPEQELEGLTSEQQLELENSAVNVDIAKSAIEEGRRQKAEGRRTNQKGILTPPEKEPLNESTLRETGATVGVLNPCSLQPQQELGVGLPPASCPLTPASFDKDAAKGDEETEKVTKTTPRRLVIVDGGKGGVGKSMWTRGFLQTCINEKRKIMAVDADNSNPDLLRYYGEDGEHCQIQQLNIFKDGSIERFFDQIKIMIEPELDTYNQLPPSESLFLLELPPQSRQIFKRFVEQDFLETAAIDYDIRVTIVVVISRVSDSVKQLIDLYEFCGINADYIVVKNLFYGEESEFSRYSNSSRIKEIKQELSKNGVPIFDIVMPDLLEYAYDYLDEHSLTFSEGISQKKLPGVKMRVKSWLKTFKGQIEPVKHLLGLESINIETY